LNRFAIGTVQFGLPYGIANREGQVSLDEARAILKFAEAASLDTLDTAMAYGNSEHRLGEIGVSQWQVVSKLPVIPVGCPDVAAWVRASVAASLDRLHIRRLRGLLLHDSGQLLGTQGTALYGALTQLKTDGLVQKIGVSIYEPEELDALSSTYNFDMVQAPLNIFDRRLIDSGWLVRLSHNGIEVHVRSVFLQGLLLMQPANRPEKFNRWQPLWSRWQKWLGDIGLTPVQACLRTIPAQPEIDRVIVGVDRLTQLKEILSAAEGDLLDVPAELHCEDVRLINPAHWNTF
jgi:aryl-alcohol dehydrogenase-like predicted oxidoreductase